MTRYWFIHGKLLATSVARPRFYAEQRGNPMGFAFFCPTCCELWATCPVDGQKSQVWAIPCEQHQHDGCPVPGSLYLSWEPEFMQEMPAAVWQRELAVHLRFAASTFTDPIASNARAMLPFISPSK